MESTSNRASCCNFNDLRVTFDNVCDFIPVVSTITMTIGAVQKYLYVPDMEVKGSLKDDHYYTHLKNKDFERSWLLFVPGVNFVVAMIAYCSPEASKVTTLSSSTQINIEDEVISSEELTDREEEAKIEIEEKKADEERRAIQDEIKSQLLLEKAKTLESLYPGININDIIQQHPHIDETNFKEILYETLIEEAPCYYLSPTEMKRALEAFNLCTTYVDNIKTPLLAICQIIKLLTPKSCDMFFKIISNIIPEYQSPNLINAANFFLYRSPDVDPAFSIDILQKIVRSPKSKLNIILFSDSNWDVLNSLSDPSINSRLISCNPPGWYESMRLTPSKEVDPESKESLKRMGFFVTEIEAKQTRVNVLIEIITNAFALFDLDVFLSQDSCTAIVQIISRLEKENSDMLLKLISSLEPERQGQNLINAASWIEKNPKEDFTLSLQILQKIYNSPNAYIRLFNCESWETLSAINDIAKAFPTQWEKIVDVLLGFDYQKIQSYRNIYWSPEVKKIEIDIAKVITWSDIFMKKAPTKPVKSSFRRIRSDISSKDIGLHEVITKIVKIPPSQYKVLNNTFLETIRSSTLSVKDNLKLLDKALLHDTLLEKCCLLLLAKDKLFPYADSNADNLAFIEAIKNSLLPLFVNVMFKK